MALVSGWTQLPNEVLENISRFLPTRGLGRARQLDRSSCEALSGLFFKRFNADSQTYLVHTSRGSFGAVNFINLQALLRNNTKLIQKICLTVRVAQFTGKSLSQSFLADAGIYLFDNYSMLTSPSAGGIPRPLALNLTLYSYLSDLNEVRKIVSHIFSEILGCNYEHRETLEICAFIINLLREQHNVEVDKVIDEEIFLKVNRSIKPQNDVVDRFLETFAEDENQIELRKMSESERLTFFDDKAEEYTSAQLFIISLSTKITPSIYRKICRNEDEALNCEYLPVNSTYSLIFQQLQRQSGFSAYLGQLNTKFPQRLFLYDRVVTLTSSTINTLAGRVTECGLYNINVDLSRKYGLFLKSLCHIYQRESNDTFFSSYVLNSIKHKQTFLFSTDVDDQVLRHLNPLILSKHFETFLEMFSKNIPQLKNLLLQLEDYILNCNQQLTPFQFIALYTYLDRFGLSLKNILACLFKRFPNKTSEYKAILPPSDKELQLQCVDMKNFGEAFASYLDNPFYSRGLCRVHSTVAERLTWDHVQALLIPRLGSENHNVLNWTCANLSSFALTPIETNEFISFIINSKPKETAFFNLCKFISSRPWLIVSKSDITTVVESYFLYFNHMNFQSVFFFDPLYIFLQHCSFKELLPHIINFEANEVRSEKRLNGNFTKVYMAVAAYANRDFYMTPQDQITYEDSVPLKRLDLMKFSDIYVRLLQLNFIESDEVPNVYVKEVDQKLELSRTLQTIQLFE